MTMPAAPRSAKVRAMVAPRPWVPPVTTAILPSRRAAFDVMSSSILDAETPLPVLGKGVDFDRCVGDSGQLLLGLQRKFLGELFRRPIGIQSLPEQGGLGLGGQAALGRVAV